MTQKSRIKFYIAHTSAQKIVANARKIVENKYPGNEVLITLEDHGPASPYEEKIYAKWQQQVKDALTK